jgi:hypothetical protein
LQQIFGIIITLGKIAEKREEFNRLVPEMVYWNEAALQDTLARDSNFTYILARTTAQNSITFWE